MPWKSTNQNPLYILLFCCVFFYPIRKRCYWYNRLINSGVQRSTPVIISHISFLLSAHWFDCCYMKLNGIRWKQIQCKVLIYTNSTIKWKFIVFVEMFMLITLSWPATASLVQKTNYPGIHIFLSFWKMKNVNHHCEQSLMVTLLWVVVIHHTIFQMRPF